MTDAMSPVEMARVLRALDVPADKIDAAVRSCTPAPVAKKPRAPEPVTAVTQMTLGLFQRSGDVLRLVLHVAPRTKKNGTVLGIRQTPAYRRYCKEIVDALEPFKTAQMIPLTERHYNIAATYYVDRRGEKADKVGLDQGLYDALENAGVVTDDWQFRTADGTRIVFGDPVPRVELTITPIEETCPT